MNTSSSRVLPQSAAGVADAAVPARTARPRAAWPVWLLPIFALGCWALAVRHLSAEWTFNEQYQFGWLVPLLVAYLIKVRFESVPAASPAPRSWVINVALLLLAIASVLIMPIREANLDWRLVQWGLVGVAIAASLVCFWQMGGWPWVRHFTFPLLFFLIAVPIPRNLEEACMDRLMMNNTNLSVELLNWIGIDAMAQGNLIQLSTGTLGVDEACSGIRSLQSTLMLSLFLGEIFALSRLRRMILLAAGLGWALVSNVGRTSFLGAVSARDGLAAVDRWHDTAGFSVLALCAVAVTATAWILHRTSAQRDLLFAHSRVLDGFALIAARLRPAAAFAGVGLALLVTGLGLTKAWFDYRGRFLTQVADWEFRLPTHRTAFRDAPIAPRTRTILRYDEGFSGMWTGDEKDRWHAFYFRWLPERTVAQSMQMHDPRICLGRAGMELISELPPVTFERGNVSLVFDAYHFRDGAEELFVFNCLAEDVRSATGLRGALTTGSPRERIAAAVAGRRQAGQRRVELAVWDARDASAAAETLRSLLNEQIQLASHPPGR